MTLVKSLSIDNPLYNERLYKGLSFFKGEKMLKASYRNDAHYQGLDIHFEDYLLPEVLKGVISSLEYASVTFLKISQSHLTEENNNDLIRKNK